jgi:UDP-GlcNAc:undecaprenyl-phosphate GlcNAc-1-phosphate transferase
MTLAATPVMRRLSERTGFLDHPSGPLKPHNGAMPNLGGFAVLLGFTPAVSIGYLIEIGDAGLVRIVLIGAVISLTTGMWDDRHDVRGFKLIGQCALGILLSFSGLHFAFITNPFINVIITTALVILCCNALNLTDGIDGLASGITLIISSFFFILFMIDGNGNGMLLALASAGCMSAFLIYNFNPASIYLGNNGSMLAGFLIAVMIIIYPASIKLNHLITPFVLLIIPFTDAALSFLRRSLRGRSFLEGDRSHFYDHLVNSGLSIKKVNIIIYIVCCTFGVISILISRGPANVSVVLFGIISFLIVLVILKMRFYRLIE